MRRNLGRERGGVRRDHQFVRRRAAQRKTRHALRRILICQGFVLPGIGRLGDAPRHTLRGGEGDLLA